MSLENTEFCLITNRFYSIYQTI